MNRRHFLLTTAASAFAVTLTACGKKLIVGRKVPAGASVLALGDSITFSIGATPEASYPAVLARLTGWNVINASISGDTSGEALARLPALLQQHSPQLVLMSIGGNDFLRHQPESEARSNVRRICEMAASAGAQALLIAIPAFSASALLTGSLSDHPMYEEVAQSLKIPLHVKGWSTVLSNPATRSDEIHANAQGYEAFANGLLATVKAANLL